MTGSRVPSLACQGIDMDEQILLENVFVLKDIPVNGTCIFSKSHVKQYKHLRDLNISSDANSQIDMLIGTDNPYLFWCLDSRRGSPSEPYAQKGPLGWYVVGSSKKPSCSEENKANVMMTHIAPFISPVNLNVSVPACEENHLSESCKFQTSKLECTAQSCVKNLVDHNGSPNNFSLVTDNLDFLFFFNHAK